VKQAASLPASCNKNYLPTVIKVVKSLPENQIANPSPGELEALIDRAIEGQSVAFGKLYDLHVQRIYRHIYYRVGNHADAEDLTQQAFVKAWQAIGRYRKTGSPFIAWMITISHHLVVDFYRSNRDRLMLDLEAASPPETDPVLMAEASFDQRRMRQAVNSLHGDQQQVVLMRFIEGFTNPEIAAALGKNEGAVRVALHRGLANLKKILEKDKA
jgi:RNA polymerase sigma-70 factor (ECF subfamily)